MPKKIRRKKSKLNDVLPRKLIHMHDLTTMEQKRDFMTLWIHNNLRYPEMVNRVGVCAYNLGSPKSESLDRCAIRHTLKKHIDFISFMQQGEYVYRIYQRMYVDGGEAILFEALIRAKLRDYYKQKKKDKTNE